MVKVVCLGNEFIEGDSLAKEVGVLLAGDYEIVNVRDSFELMGIVSSGIEFVVLDVVLGLKEVRRIDVQDLRVDSIASAHDFDAAYVLKLMNAEAQIIGMPMEGDAEEVVVKVRKLIAHGLHG